MNSSGRETFLRMLLPALGVVIVYLLGFNRDGELRTARESLEAARASAVDPDSLPPMRMRLETTAAEQQRLAADKETVDARWLQLTMLPAASSTARTAALRQLTRMLWDRGLYPFEESPAEATGRLPASFDDLLKKLTAPGGGSQPRLWKVRFYGRYSDVAETLAALGELDSALVPISLTMSDAATDTTWRVWTLVLWI